GRNADADIGQTEIDDQHDDQWRQRTEHVDEHDDQRIERLDLKRTDDGERKTKCEAGDDDRECDLDRGDDTLQDRGQILRDEIRFEEGFEEGVHLVSSAMNAFARASFGAPNICAGSPSSTITP